MAHSTRRGGTITLRKAVMLTAWGLLLGAALGLGLATTAGPSPRSEAEREPPSPAEPVEVAALQVPSPAEPASPAASADTIAKTVAVGKGDTLMKVLLRAGAERGQAYQAIAALKRVFNPRKLKAGQEVTLTFQPPGAREEGAELLRVALDTSVERQVLARRRDDGSFAPGQLIRDFRRSLVRASGDIDDSLYLAARRAALPVGVLMETIRIFSWDVDFQRDIHPGDRFEVVFERHFDEAGRAVREGAIESAALTLSGTRLEFYRYTPSDDGIADYFDAQGQSVRRALLRTPVDGARLTSRYGKRQHPILGYTRMHRGVDFGAPTGTPIYAAGDGLVEAAGWEGNFGRYVRLRHNRELKTAYAHMRRIAKGVRRGKRVRQGQVIGYVGSSGLSTGPHLHYEIISKGRKVNPMSLKLPTGRRLEGAELARFQKSLAELTRRVAQAQALSTRIAEGAACGEPATAGDAKAC